MTIAEMQDAILSAGYQFVEHIFNDGNARNCYIQFSRKQSPHAFDTNYYDNGYDPARLGWGRFERTHAWEMAYKYIVLGVIDE